MQKMTDVALRRSQMGRGIGRLAEQPGMTCAVESGFWLTLTGLPSADLNMALVHSGDVDDLERALSSISAMGGPALLMLAGEARGSRLPAEWSDVGDMPIMGRDLADIDAEARDVRVRPIRPTEVAAVAEMVAGAYGLDVEQVVLAVELGSHGERTFQTWVLENESQLVSTVTTCRVEDTVSIWIMATPERFGRRGFGRALLAGVLAETRLDGADLGLLGATPAGLPLYESTGWVTFEEWQINVNASSAQFAH